MDDIVVPRRWFRSGVQFVRTATTVSGLTLLVGLGAVSMVADPTPAAPSEQLGMSTGPLDALMQENRCSVTGFDRDVVPSKAIVRTPNGGVDLVTFERGWAVFSGEVAGELVAVCLGPKKQAGPLPTGKPLTQP